MSSKTMSPKWNPKNIYCEGVKEVKRNLCTCIEFTAKKPTENDSKVKTNNWSVNVLLVITFVPAEEDGPAASTACWPNPCLCISTCSSGA